MPAPIPEPAAGDQRPGRAPEPDGQQPPGVSGPGGQRHPGLPGAPGQQSPADAHADSQPSAGGPGRPAAGGADAAQAQPVWGGPGWAWVEGSADSGPVPGRDRPGPQPEPPTGDGLPAGLDYAALVAALGASGALGSDADDQDGELAEWRAAEEEGRLEPADLAAVAAAAV
jgi:hypothetical protein